MLYITGISVATSSFRATKNFPPSPKTPCQGHPQPPSLGRRQRPDAPPRPDRHPDRRRARRNGDDPLRRQPPGRLSRQVPPGGVTALRGRLPGGLRLLLHEGTRNTVPPIELDAHPFSRAEDAAGQDLLPEPRHPAEQQLLVREEDPQLRQRFPVLLQQHPPEEQADQPEQQPVPEGREAVPDGRPPRGPAEPLQQGLQGRLPEEAAAGRRRAELPDRAEEDGAEDIADLHDKRGGGEVQPEGAVLQEEFVYLVEQQASFC